MYAVTRGPQCLELSFALPYLFPQGEFGFEVWNSLLVSEIVFAGFHFLPRALDIPKWLKNIFMYILEITIGYRVRAVTKRFCSIALLCVNFTWQIVKTHVIRLWKVADPNTHDRILCIPFILSGSPSESCLHTYVRNNNLENRIAGYSYRLQLIFIYTIQEHSAQMTSVEWLICNVFRLLPWLSCKCQKSEKHDILSRFTW